MVEQAPPIEAKCFDVTTIDGQRTVEKPCTNRWCFWWDASAWVNAAQMELLALTRLRPQMIGAEIAEMHQIQNTISNLAVYNFPAYDVSQARRNVFEAVTAAQHARCLRATIKARLENKPVDRPDIKNPNVTDPISPDLPINKNPGLPVSKNQWELPGVPGLSIDMDSDLWRWLVVLVPVAALGIGAYAYITSKPARAAIKRVRKRK